MVLVLERVPTSLRGELTRWLLEPRTGVFVGNVSAQVRDLLWLRVRERLGDGGAMLVHNADTEQGFAVRAIGDPSRELADYDGMTLVREPAWKRRTRAKAGSTNTPKGGSA